MADRVSKPPASDPLFVRPPQVERMRDPLQSAWNRALSVEGADDVAELIDFAQMNAIFEGFLAVVGLPVAIIDLKGQVLASSKWQRLCMEFHRVNDGTRARCIESDIGLSTRMREGSSYAMYRCANGLTDCASPIVVEGRHIANLFIGQFLLGEPDLEDFSRRQRTFGFDRDAYFKALAEVPIIAEEKLPAILDLLANLARQVADQSLARKRTQRALAMIEVQVDERTRELEASRDRLRRIAALVPGMMFQFRLDADGTACFPYASDAIRDLLGLEPAEVQFDAAKAFERVHPDDLAALWDSIHLAALTLTTWCHEFRVRDGTGRLRWLYGHGTTQPDGADAVQSYGFLADVTEIHRRDEALRASEERFRTLFHYSPVAYQALDAEGLYIDLNDTLCALLGYERADLIGRSFGDVWSPATRDRFAAAMAAFLANGRIQVEQELVRRDGTPVTVQLEGRIQRDPDGTFMRSHCVLYDVTARKQMERDLARSNAELEQFAYVASHDLREPLRMITSYLTLIERRYGAALDGDGQEFLAFAVDGARRMDRLILDLLDYSRIGRMGRADDAVNLADAVAEALANLRTTVAEARAAVTVETAPANVTGSRSELVRLFQNLIGNALKYRDPERAPQIAVGWLRHGAEWTVSVADNGIGIAPEHHTAVFQIFRRLHTRQQYEGTGIGLAECEKIVRHHGGRIWVESELGQGSTFRFTIPVAIAPAGAMPPEPGP
ncbi:MAG: PocR ligand-binding domain-containing protein [Magnetospirillum sp.]|nr:PocR ligand-binding domain-containing protein [Magnetospirillum sp.]